MGERGGIVVLASFKRRGADALVRSMSWRSWSGVSGLRLQDGAGEKIRPEGSQGLIFFRWHTCGGRFRRYRILLYGILDSQAVGVFDDRLLPGKL